VKNRLEGVTFEVKLKDDLELSRLTTSSSAYSWRYFGEQEWIIYSCFPLIINVSRYFTQYGMESHNSSFKITKEYKYH